MMDDCALTELALAAQRGDRGAATELARQTYPQVWRTLTVLSNRAVAEDLAQETYTRAFRSLPGFRAESSVRTWLLSIARRVAADHIRASQRQPWIDTRADMDETISSVPGDVSESVVLHDLLDHLEPDRRLAFVLTQLVGLNYAETAQVCGCPVGTIRSRVARAREQLTTLVLGDDHDFGRRRNRL